MKIYATKEQLKTMKRECTSIRDCRDCILFDFCSNYLSSKILSYHIDKDGTPHCPNIEDIESVTISNAVLLSRQADRIITLGINQKVCPRVLGNSDEIASLRIKCVDTICDECMLAFICNTEVFQVEHFHALNCILIPNDKKEDGNENNC